MAPCDVVSQYENKRRNIKETAVAYLTVSDAIIGNSCSQILCF